MASTEVSGFPIPSSLQDLEREPYNLLPYPHDFDDGDEVARADSFSALVDLLDEGNQSLLSDGIVLFQQEEGQAQWLQNDRIQAFYTLVRYAVCKSVIRFEWSKLQRELHILLTPCIVTH
jgi:hypothetical protein